MRKRQVYKLGPYNFLFKKTYILPLLREDFILHAYCQRSITKNKNTSDALIRSFGKLGTAPGRFDVLSHFHFSKRISSLPRQMQTNTVITTRVWLFKCNCKLVDI